MTRTISGPIRATISRYAVRSHLVKTTRLMIEAMIHEIMGVKVLSLHHDINTLACEEVVLFTLAEPPLS